MSDDLAVDEHMPTVKQHRILLELGAEQGWWTVESENDPGHVDRAGNSYGVVTYTLVLPHHTGEDEERVLLASEVKGYVLATADQYGDEGVRAIAYRPGLVGPPQET